ncbi:MAG: ribbon-helix-helix protein, CopG family [Acidimicrobiia bacterium]
MPRVEKVTVSLPAELLARIEEHRAGDGRNRSEVVAELLWRGWQVVEHEAREERYRRAYAAEPDTAEERAWAEMAADELLVPAEARPARPARPTGPARKRRAAG